MLSVVWPWCLSSPGLSLLAVIAPAWCAHVPAPMSPCQMSHWCVPLMTPDVLSAQSLWSSLLCSAPLQENNFTGCSVSVRGFYSSTRLGVCATSISGKKIQPTSLSLEEARNGFWNSFNRAASPESRPVLRPWVTETQHRGTCTDPGAVLHPHSLPADDTLVKHGVLLNQWPFLDFFCQGRHCTCLLSSLPFS